MEQFTIYTVEGKETGKMAVPSLFQVAVDEKLIHRYVTWVRTMLRSTIAHTKNRGEVSGGGKKPWKQKGTGRARVGSTRNPVWRHGGVSFGPRSTQTYATRMPKQERRKAFMSALSSKAESVVLVDEITMETPKTQQAVAMLAKLPRVAGHKVLHIAPAEDAAILLSLRNIPGVTATTVTRLNVLDVMNNDVLLLTKEGLAALEQHFTPSV